MAKQCELFDPVLAPTEPREPAPERTPAAPSSPARRMPAEADALCFDPELAALEREVEQLRPKQRSECEAGPRPCPWVSCPYHLWRERERLFGALVDDDGVALDDWGDTCTLDVAERVDWRSLPPDKRRSGEASERRRRVAFVQVRVPPEQVEVGAVRVWEVSKGSERAVELDNKLVGRLLGISREQVRLDRESAQGKLVGEGVLVELLGRDGEADEEG